MQIGTLVHSQRFAAVTLRAVLPEEYANHGSAHQRKRAAHAERVGRIPGNRRIQMLFGNEIFRNNPALKIPGKNQSCLGLAQFLAAVVSTEKVITHVVTDDL